MRPPASAEWLWYCVRLWSTSVDQSDSARGVSTPAIAGQASSAQAILRGQVLGTISEGCNTPRVPAHCCIPLRSLYSDISQCDFRRGLGLGWVEAWDISEQRIPRSFHLRPFIVLTITKRAHYKAKSEATCRVSVLKLVSPNQPDSQQLWGQSTSKPNALILHEQAPLVGYSCEPRHQLSWLGS